MHRVRAYKMISSSRPPKGTLLRENASFDVYIVKIGPLWQPAGVVKKRKKEKKESHKQ